MRVLVYKRNHRGDPDTRGLFGCNGCMGYVRRFRFGAVIGVGGTGAKAKSSGVARKLNWIGIGPIPDGFRNRGPVLAFKHFRIYGDEGGSLSLRRSPALLQIACTQTRCTTS
jgi:hypothetical protein